MGFDAFTSYVFLTLPVRYLARVRHKKNPASVSLRTGVMTSMHESTVRGDYTLFSGPAILFAKKDP
jgi:hypothetical protein